MEHAGRDRVMNDSNSVSLKEAPSEPPPWVDTAASRRSTALSRHLRTVVSGMVALGLVMTIAHLALVFLHVAPSNPFSQRYEKQIHSWVYPLFEQNWRLFAPNPESVDRQISVRTRHTTADGESQVSPWFDLTALDNAAVRHHIAPSHTAQNTLRRAWTAYVEMHGNTDESHSERAVMMEQYLRNVAAQRVSAARGGDFEALQMRVVTQPITGPAGAEGSRPQPQPAETRNLPWWKVERDAL